MWKENRDPAGQEFFQQGSGRETRYQREDGRKPPHEPDAKLGVHDVAGVIRLVVHFQLFSVFDTGYSVRIAPKVHTQCVFTSNNY